MTKILRVPVKTDSEIEAEEVFYSYTRARDYVVTSKLSYQFSLDEQEITVVAEVQTNYETK